MISRCFFKANPGLVEVHLRTRANTHVLHTSINCLICCECQQIVFQESDHQVVHFVAQLWHCALFRDSFTKKRGRRNERDTWRETGRSKWGNDILSSFVISLFIFVIFILKACSYLETAQQSHILLAFSQCHRDGSCEAAGVLLVYSFLLFASVLRSPTNDLLGTSPLL